jgi:hypothetical protein
MLYFSYGSNMSQKRLLARVSSASFVVTAKLKQHDLRFHKQGMDGSGKCDAYQTDNPDHHIIGAIYDINEVEKPILDAKEGLGNGYDEKRVLLTLSSGEAIKAFTYFATNIDKSLKPYEWYKYHVLQGATENELPEEYIQNIINIESISDPEKERHACEMAIYL